MSDNVGRAQLKDLGFIRKKKQLANHYAKFLSKSPFLKLVLRCK